MSAVVHKISPWHANACISKCHRVDVRDFPLHPTYKSMKNLQNHIKTNSLKVSSSSFYLKSRFSAQHPAHSDVAWLQPKQDLSSGLLIFKCSLSALLQIQEVLGTFYANVAALWKDSSVWMRLEAGNNHTRIVCKQEMLSTSNLRGRDNLVRRLLFYLLMSNSPHYAYL